jgi:sugar phosphate permease
MSANKPARKPVFFGWYVVAASVFIGFSAVGARNGFGAFVTPMSDEFEWNRLTISFAAGLGILLNGFIQPFMGQVFDRTGGRKLIMVSVLALGLVTISLYWTFNFLFFVFVFGILASVAQSGLSLTNTSALLSRWFSRLRGTVIGINSTALSIGGLVLVPLAVYLMDATGSWRIAWIGLGGVVLLSLPLAWVFMRENPAEMNLRPDGDDEPSEDAVARRPERTPGPLEAASWRESLRSWPFWQMSGAYFVCGATTFILSIHFIPYAEDRGMERGTAALIFAVMSGLNIVGATSAGFLSDKIGGTKNWLTLVYSMRGLAYLLLLVTPLIPGMSTAGLWIFACIAGFSWIATLPLTSSLTAEVYGLRAMGTISGITFMFHQIGGFVSVTLAGWLYDVTGSYTLPFAIAGSLLGLAAISAFSIRERKYSARYQQPTTQTVWVTDA